VAAASAWGFGGRAVLLVANLLATPFTIRLLGPSAYGLWSLLVLAVTWAAKADLGMGSASTKFGAERYARNDDRGESAVVWTSLGIICVTTASAAAAMTIGAHMVLQDLMHVRGRLLPSGVTALRIGCLVFAVQAASGVVNTPQLVRLRWRQWTLVSTAANLVLAIGTPVALVVLSGGVVTASAVCLAAAALALLGNGLLAARLQPALRYPRWDRALMKQLLGYGGALTVAGLAAIPLTTAERFFLGYEHSTMAVAYYSVAATLATTIQVFPEQVLGPMLPALARLEAEGRFEELRALYHKALVGLFLVLTPAAIMLALLAQPFLSIWAGPAYGSHSTGPFLVVMTGVWLSCLALVPNSYLLSSGRTKLLAYAQVAELVPYLAAAWVLTAKFGVIGAALVWSARFVLDSVLQFALVKRVAPLPVLPLSERRWRAMACLLALGCSAVLVAGADHGLVDRLALGAGLASTYAVAVWRLVLTAGEREGLVNLAAQVVRKGTSLQAGGRAM
jgi:O-antigen/teichoic acid export membrane protein